VLHGAPVTTQPERQLLLAKFGPPDVLGMIGKSRTSDDLRGHTRTMEIEPGVVLRVLDMETLIEVKEELGFPKDAAVLPVLRQALKEWSETAALTVSKRVPFRTPEGTSSEPAGARNAPPAVPISFRWVVG
jgi:hypothetical protein